MSRFIKETYRLMDSYTPGEQPRDRKYIKLNTNESPYPPPQDVIDAVGKDELSDVRLYPDPTCNALKQKLASYYGVTKENIFISNGSDDILNFSFMAFGGRDMKVAYPEISYGFYKVYAKLYGLNANEIRLRKDFSIDASDYMGLNEFIVIANPNAPTGMTISCDDIKKICMSNKDNVVLIDEAYVDFGAESCVSLTKELNNLLVVMTYSKSRSMAGARLGFAIGNKELIEDLEKLKYSTNPYSVNRMTAILGEIAINNSSYYKKMCDKIIKTREETSERLRNLGFFVLPSKANFIFVRKEGISGEKLYSYLRDNGILVRYFSDNKINEFVRITIGTDEDINRLVDVLKTVEATETEIK